jgi:hypothetical protein
LANGAVYVAFASIDDADPWHGWLIGYNAANIQQQVSVYNSTPDGNGGGIWQSGRGPVSDATGNLYLMTGNGDYDGTNNFGDSMVKLSSAATTEDWFTPDDQNTLALQDEDLGSGGPLLIPNTNLLVGGGKQGILYVVDSSNMGHLQAGNGQIVQSFQATNVPFSGEIHHVAYWDRSGAPLLYLWGSNDVLNAFQFGNGRFNTTPVAQGGLNAFFPGGVLAVSANGSTPGTGIVWATTPTSDTTQSVRAGTLRAFDASDVSHELWDSDQNAARDTLGNFAKFALPTIANGKVYVPTFSNQLAVYGLVANTPPGVSIWVGPASVTLTADGQQQQFTATVAGTSNTAVTWSMSPSVGTLTANGLYTAPSPGVISSSLTVTITAISVADPTKSANATVTLTPIVSTGTASFVGLDTTIQGNWKGVYGADGYNIINDTVAYPSYVTVTPSGVNATTWVGSSTDVRALLKAASSTDRIAATWYTTSSSLIDIDMVFNDGLQHQVAVYCLDWDTTTRAETIVILDANGVVLNTQQVSNFHNGQYLVWQLSGHVRIRVTDTAGANGVISGLFFDSRTPTVAVSVGPASVTLTANGQQQFTAAVRGTNNTAVTWSMNPSVGTLTTSGLYTAPAAISSAQTITITATSVADPTKSANATVTLSTATATNSATFVTLDTTTQGNWKGVYGSNGYNVINDTVAYPSYVTVTPSSVNAFTWVGSSTDVRALRKAASSTDRIAATWYNTSPFLIDMVFNDGLQHQVAAYCLDWDTTTRAETIDILDANGVVLNTQQVSNFHNGQYLVWQLSGHVRIRVTDTAGANGVISGLFFDTTAPASSFTLTGPSGGALNTASTSFTVTPNGTYNGTITITPSGGGLSIPITRTFNNSAAPQTFTITPTAVGPVTLTPSNNGSLTNPPALTYATPPGAPTIGTATAGSGLATVSFTPPARTGGSPITSYTATCGSKSVSGTASPITVTGLSNGTSYTCTVTASNAAGISVPSAASNSVTPGIGTTTPITLGVHAAHDTAASSATTVVVGPITPTAGSTMYCAIKYPIASTLPSISDNVNSGVYQPAVSRLRESAHNFLFATYYKENVAASATTITLTYTTTGTHAQMACKEIKGVPASYALDSSVTQSQAVNGANPATPNSYTPFANGEMVLSDAYISTGTVTAGTNFTLLDNTGTLDPEYWIQTTKTATTGAFADVSAADNAVGMAAFGPNVGGNCDGTVVIDWSGAGAANAGTPTTTTLQASTHGDQAQPNADNVNPRPGVWILGGSAAGITYATAAYRPLVTSRTCPFYTGSGTGTLGLAKTSNAAGGIGLGFDTLQSKVTHAACFFTDTPVSHSGTIDTLSISGGDSIGNPDYVLIQVNSNGSTSSFVLETQSGSTNSSTAWVQNTSYWIRIEYNKASFHKAYIYTFSGANCTGTPTLQETITASTTVTGGGPADTLSYFTASDSYATGTNFYFGSAIADIYYGSSLMP